MRNSRWQPLPDDVMGAARELATQSRLLMDRAGLTLRQLAADDRVSHDVSTLRGFLSGRPLPPREVVEVIAERCGGDREQLLSTLHRAVVARDAGLPWAAAETAPRPRRSFPRGRTTLITAALVGLVVGTNVLTALVVRLTDRSSPNNAAAAARSGPPSSSGSASSRTPGPGARTQGTPSATRPPSRGRQPVPQQTRGNLIRNGTFTDTTMSWWPVSDVRISSDADRLRADVRDGGSQPSDRIVSAASFPLRSGRTYTLGFDAAASADITDRVTIQLDSQPYTAVLSHEIGLTTSMRHFSYQFTANITTNQAALNFELGDHDGDHSFWLDNVTLVSVEL
jgi:carbohydrate binding protein with CBM4/9 domain/helix-turn-helix protein